MHTALRHLTLIPTPPQLSHRKNFRIRTGEFMRRIQQKLNMVAIYLQKREVTRALFLQTAGHNSSRETRRDVNFVSAPTTEGAKTLFKVYHGHSSQPIALAEVVRAVPACLFIRACRSSQVLRVGSRCGFRRFVGLRFTSTLPLMESAFAGSASADRLDTDQREHS